MSYTHFCCTKKKSRTFNIDWLVGNKLICASYWLNTLWHQIKCAGEMYCGMDNTKSFRGIVQSHIEQIRKQGRGKESTHTERRVDVICFGIVEFESIWNLKLSIWTPETQHFTLILCHFVSLIRLKWKSIQMLLVLVVWLMWRRKCTRYAVFNFVIKSNIFFQLVRGLTKKHHFSYKWVFFQALFHFKIDLVLMNFIFELQISFPTKH